MLQRRSRDSGSDSDDQIRGSSRLKRLRPVRADAPPRPHSRFGPPSPVHRVSESFASDEDGGDDDDDDDQTAVGSADDISEAKAEGSGMDGPDQFFSNEQLAGGAAQAGAGAGAGAGEQKRAARDRDAARGAKRETFIPLEPEHDVSDDREVDDTRDPDWCFMCACDVTGTVSYEAMKTMKDTIEQHYDQVSLVHLARMVQEQFVNNFKFLLPLEYDGMSWTLRSIIRHIEEDYFSPRIELLRENRVLKTMQRILRSSNIVKADETGRAVGVDRDAVNLYMRLGTQRSKLLAALDGKGRYH
jgi:hypothetical protein